LLILLAGRDVRAQEYSLLPDTLQSMDLTAEFSPYLADGLVVVADSAWVWIHPGVTIYFTAEADQTLGQLKINGSLTAVGHEDSLIVFTRSPESDPQLRWRGVLANETVEGNQTLLFHYVQVEQASTGIYLAREIPPWGTSAHINRCIFIDNYTGIQCWNPGSYLISNCDFDSTQSQDIIAVNCRADIRNNVFLPNPDNIYKIGILCQDLDNQLEFTHGYNCFFPDDGNFTRHVWIYDHDISDLIIVELDSTNIVGDPIFLEDPPYHPDPEESPLIDAGDPEILDPDFTVSDIGAFWVAGDPVPFRFMDDTYPTEWVVGYDFRAEGTMASYPLPFLEPLILPSGMIFSQQGRNQYSLSWLPFYQVEGQHQVRIAGYNVINDISYHDTLDVILDFGPNHAPSLSWLEPCSDGPEGCLEQDTVLVDYVSASDSLLFKIVIADEDSARLGDYQFINSSLRRETDILAAGHDTLETFAVLDTQRTSFRLDYSDGFLRDSLLFDVVSRYEVLEGEVSGVLGPESGALFVGGPLRVAEQDSLEILPGTRLVMDEVSEPDEWLLDVEGSLKISGSPEEPVEFVSLAEIQVGGFAWEGLDKRPLFLRIGPGAEVLQLSHTLFRGMGEAIRVEYAADPLVVDHCTFENSRIGVLAVGTPVQIRSCRFVKPADTLRLGSYGIYLAESSGSVIRNNLFIDPVIGVALAEASAEIANNSFHNVLTGVPGYWPMYNLLGYGRIHCYGGSISVRNNLFHWKTELAGELHSIDQLEDLLLSRQHAVWLDEQSDVSMRYNWYDCVDCMLMDSTVVWADLTRYLAVSDSLLLSENLANGNGDARFDTEEDFRLFADSPLIDAGEPGAAWYDAHDGSPNDIGWFGGPWAENGGYSEVEPGGGPDEPAYLLPEGLLLHDPRPNPFNPATTLKVELGQTGRLRLEVYNLLGQVVAVLADDMLEPGVYYFRFDGGRLASGTYFAHARSPVGSQTVKLLLLK